MQSQHPVKKVAGWLKWQRKPSELEERMRSSTGEIHDISRMKKELLPKLVGHILVWYSFLKLVVDRSFKTTFSSMSGKKELLAAMWLEYPLTY